MLKSDGAPSLSSGTRAFHDFNAPGHDTLVTHVFAADSPYLDSDAVFGVKNGLIREFTREGPSRAPDGRVMKQPWRKLGYDFGLQQARAPARRRGAA